MSGRKHIYFVWNYTNWGGAQIYFFALIREAVKYYQVKVIVPKNSPQRIFDYLDTLDIEYGFLSEVPESAEKKNFWGKISAQKMKIESDLRLVNELFRCVNFENSIVHIDLGFWHSFLPLLRLSLKTKVFTTIHTALPMPSVWRFLIWKLKGKFFGRLKNFHIMASNKDAKIALEPYLTKEKFEEIEIAYSGFNSEEIANVLSKEDYRNELCEKFGLPKNKILIFSLAQFIERKGCWIVLDALHKLKAKRSDFFFVWLGTSAPDAPTSEKLEGYEVADCFTLITAEKLGKTRDDLLSLLNIADVFVLASFMEGLPIALVEAMALGKPCIATRINAIPEAIENDKTGILIKAGSSGELVTAVEKMLNSEDLRSEMAFNARKKALDYFDEKKSAQITLRLYEKSFAKSV